MVCILIFRGEWIQNLRLIIIIKSSRYYDYDSRVLQIYLFPSIVLGMVSLLAPWMVVYSIKSSQQQFCQNPR